MNRFVAELSELQLRCRAGFAGALLPLPASVAKQQGGNGSPIWILADSNTRMFGPHHSAAGMICSIMLSVLSFLVSFQGQLSWGWGLEGGICEVWWH